MINIDTRLIDQLNGDELAVFIHILKRIGKQNKSFPSRYTLQKETSFGRRRVADAIAGLNEKGIIETKQENKNGNFGKTIYKISTDLAGVFITAKNEEIEEKPTKNGAFDRETGNRTTVNRTTVNGQVSINKSKYYSYQEINNIKSVNTPENLEKFKEDILKRFPEYSQFDLKYYFERVNIYLQSQSKEIKDFTAYAVSFMIGDEQKKQAKKSKKGCDLTVLGCDKKLTTQQRQKHFKDLLFKVYSTRYKLSDLELFYERFCKPDSQGVLLIETSAKGLNDTLIDSFIRSLQTA